MMILGFTGTRRGMTSQQLAILPFIISTLPSHLLHGGAEGADEQADRWFAEQRMPLDHISVYPCNREREEFWLSVARARPINIPARQMFNIRPPRVRNRMIVARADHLLAMPATVMPATAKEVLRSGTWATIRYARQAGVPVTIVLPDGAISL